ncbi:nucleotidyltransferase domain-containing protein [Thermoflexus hugenholtzii]
MSRDPSPRERRRMLEEGLQRFVEILRREIDPERIILFGSLRTGEIGPWSDIDLAIVMRTDQPFIERLHAIRRLLQPRAATDLLVHAPEEFKPLARERPFVREEIPARGALLYARGG